MNLPKWFVQRGYYLGPFALLYAWVTILLSAHLNPWWSWTAQSHGALSYMGDPTGSAYAWVYNYVAMVPTGILIALFAVALYGLSRNRTERWGSVIFFLAGVSLVLVGIFHQTPGHLEIYHETFSLLFFLLALISVVFWGAGILMEGRSRVSLKPLGLSAALFLAGVALVAIVLAGVVHVPTGQLYLWVILLATWLFLAFLSLVLWGVGLVKEGARPLGLGIIALAVGALALFAGLYFAFTGVPGATGEVLGIVAIDLWVGLMYFGRTPTPFEPSAEIPPGLLPPGESPLLGARPSLLHAVQVRGLLFLGLGMFLFGFSDYYLTNNLPSIITCTKACSTLILDLVEVTLVTALLGYVMVLYGVWRWSRVLPRPVAHAFFALVMVLPLVMFFDWFSASGNEVLLLYFLAVGLVLPLFLSIFLWVGTRYAVTNQRALTLVPPFPSKSLPANESLELSVHQGWIQRLADVGDVAFLRDSGTTLALEGISSERVEWRGVPHPRRTLTEAQQLLGAKEVRFRRPPRRILSFFSVFVLVLVFVLLLTTVPVFHVTDTMDLNCALDLSNIQALESNPWPYLHNVTIPPGHVTFRWWTGTPVWFAVLQLPQGIAYENTGINPFSLSNLTTNGTGAFSSYGGTSLTGCIATTQGATATLELTYYAPLVWI